MKLILEVIVSLILHPLAFILALINISSRNMAFGNKVIWGIVSIVWGVGPILYATVGGGSLW
ncbi:MAG: hypothetical protein ACREMT_04455 [Vulcanimicrobiaceae bacterium]